MIKVEHSFMDDKKEDIAAQQQVYKILETVKQVSKSPESDSSSTITPLLELETLSKSIFSSDPHLASLLQHLAQLNDLMRDLHGSKPGHGLRSFLTRRVKSHEVSQLASLIEAEIQAWIDQQTVSNLSRTIQKMQGIEESNLPSLSSSDESNLLSKMDSFIARLSRGFDIDLQDLLLRSGIFAELEWILCNSLFSKRVREKAAIAIKELVLFNKDVFVGSILVGQSVNSLVSMGSLCSLQVLCALIKAIRSPIVDEIESCNGISKIVNILVCSEDVKMQVMAMECVMQIAYFGRKEAVEAMLKASLIKKLMQLQRSERGGDLIDMGKAGDHDEEKRKERKSIERKYTEEHPFASCVARFAVQLEVGEGLRQREKRAFKQEILKRVREASVSDAEAATVVAEVLWGSSP